MSGIRVNNNNWCDYMAVLTITHDVDIWPKCGTRLMVSGEVRHAFS